jgi:hypothetical protein
MSNVGLLIATMLSATVTGCTPPTGKVDHGPWNRILREHVRDERIDYLALRSRHWDELIGYLDALATVDTAQLSRDRQLAYYINLYNATMVRAVVERFRSGYTPAADNYAVFKKPIVRLRGKSVSLNDLENRIIRPEFGEPRIHVALVCAARSCPPLVPHAYNAASLDRDLEDNMRRFLNDAARNRVDAKSRTLSLSKIFEWYADDFGGKAELAAYVNRFIPVDTTGFEIRFIEYDWSLNMTAPRDGRWVAARSGGVSLHEQPGKTVVGRADAGTVFRVRKEDAGWLMVDRPFAGGVAWLRAGATKPFALADP